jgi:hypothetical protein
MADQTKTAQFKASSIWRILLSAALILGMSLVGLFLSILVFGDPFVDPILEAVVIIIATASAAAIAIRVIDLEWRFTAPAALLSGILLIAIGWLELPFLEYDQLLSGLWLEMDTTKSLYLQAALIFLVISSAGIFLLPLFDPAVRKTGIAPSVWKVLLISLGLGVITLLVDYILNTQIGGDPGLLTLIFGSILAAVLVGAGLILVLINLQVPGAWIGGLGLPLQAIVALIWMLLGRPWFP